MYVEAPIIGYIPGEVKEDEITLPKIVVVWDDQPYEVEVDLANDGSGFNPDSLQEGGSEVWFACIPDDFNIQKKWATVKIVKKRGIGTAFTNSAAGAMLKKPHPFVESSLPPKPKRISVEQAKKAMSGDAINSLRDTRAGKSVENPFIDPYRHKFLKPEDPSAPSMLLEASENPGEDSGKAEFGPPESKFSQDMVGPQMGGASCRTSFRHHQMEMGGYTANPFAQWFPSTTAFPFPNYLLTLSGVGLGIIALSKFKE